jgi:hypothetical protein
LPSAPDGGESEKRGSRKLNGSGKSELHQVGRFCFLASRERARREANEWIEVKFAAKSERKSKGDPELAAPAGGSTSEREQDEGVVETMRKRWQAERLSTLVASEVAERRESEERVGRRRGRAGGKGKRGTVPDAVDGIEKVGCLDGGRKMRGRGNGEEEGGGGDNLLLWGLGRFLSIGPSDLPVAIDVEAGGTTPRCRFFPLPTNHNFLSSPFFASSRIAEWSLLMEKMTASSTL